MPSWGSFACGFFSGLFAGQATLFFFLAAARTDALGRRSKVRQSHQPAFSGPDTLKRRGAADCGERSEAGKRLPVD